MILHETTSGVDSARESTMHARGFTESEIPCARVVPIDVDTARGPEFLRYRYTGAFPSLTEMAVVRNRLIALGMLTAETIALMDVRELTQVADDDFLAKTVAAALEKGGWPLRRAYLIDPSRHQHMIEQFQDLAMRTVRTAAFTDENEALAWLFER